MFFYACRNGMLVQGHSRRYYYGARISHDQNGLVITSGEWRSSDPNAGPSQERREYFVWDEGTGKVVLRQTQIGEPKKR